VKVTTILRCLVTNAIKFTEAGSIRLEIACSGDTLRFAVNDTGIGISPGQRDLVFEPFRQIDGSPTRSHGGIGLGLALARKMARVLGGDIELRSAVGAGSSFTLVLPSGDAAAKPAEVAHGSAAQAPLGGVEIAAGVAGAL
jgi:signal transduction histidine kinase